VDRNASDAAFRCSPFLRRKLHDEMFWRLTEAKRNYNAGAPIGQVVNTARHFWYSRRISSRLLQSLLETLQHVDVRFMNGGAKCIALGPLIG